LHATILEALVVLLRLTHHGKTLQGGLSFRPTGGLFVCVSLLLGVAAHIHRLPLSEGIEHIRVVLTLVRSLRFLRPGHRLLVCRGGKLRVGVVLQHSR
jgi:hypothetical protein